MVVNDDRVGIPCVESEDCDCSRHVPEFSYIYSDVHHQVTRLGLVGSIKATYTGFQFTSTDVHCGTTVMWPSHDTHQGMGYAGKHQRNTSQVGRHRCHTGRLGDDQQQLCA